MARAGTLDPRDFGVYQRQPSRRMARIGKAYAAMLLLAFLFLVYMAYGDQLSGLLADRPDPESVESVGLPQHNTMP
jgi:hypothetical protein